MSKDPKKFDKSVFKLPKATVQRMQDLRRSSAASPHTNKKKYSRKNKNDWSQDW